MLRPLARLSQSHVRSQTPPPPPLHPLRWTSSLPCLSGHADTQPLPVRSLASRSVLSCRTRFAQSSCCLSLLLASVCSASERAGEARWDRAGASIQRARRAGGREGLLRDRSERGEERGGRHPRQRTFKVPVGWDDPKIRVRVTPSPKEAKGKSGFI